MTGHTIPGLAVRERMYRFLLVFLPRAFRDQFGDEIVQAFRDGYDDEYRRHGKRGARRFFRRSMTRIGTCGVRLHFDQRGNMPSLRPGHTKQAAFNLIRDTTVAVRGFIKQPGFFITAVLTIAMGVGATTTVFSVVDKVLLRALPYPDADRIVYFTNSSHSLPDFQDWRDRTESFESLVGARVVNYDWFVNDEPRRLRTALVLPGFFEVFGANTITGQPFSGSNQTGAQPVVLSHDMWQTHWGRDPNIVGRTLTINGELVVVSGVLDPQFHHPEIMVGNDIDVWMPLDESDEFYASRGIYVLEVAGKLESNRTLETAQAELQVLAEAQAAEHGDRYLNEDGSVRSETIVTMYDALTSDVSDTLTLLMGAVGLMLLIACANVANLFLARGTDRHREIALRIALGAGRTRVTSQLLVESVVLAVAGGALGVGLAVVGVKAFASLNPVAIPRIDTVAIDGRVLLFTLSISILTGIIFGVLPALQGARADANEILKSATGRVTSGRTGRRVREGLVVAEIAMSLILTAGAAVLFHSLLTAQQTDPGINSENVLTVPLALNSMNAEERKLFSDALIAELRDHPITDEVGAGVTVPFTVLGGGRCCWFMDFARAETPDADEPAVIHPVTDRYFSSLGATIIRGRDFTARDRFDETVPAIINASFANRLFGETDPIGRALLMENTTVTIVGVVADIRHWGLQEEADNQVYFPYDGAGQFFFRYYLVLRTEAPLETASDVIRSAVWSVKPDLPVETIVPLRERMSESIADSRFYSVLFAVFAAVSLSLAAAGVYSAMLYSVGQRYRELGVRLAIGARPRDITRLILKRGTLIAAIGIGLGFVGTFLLIRTIEHLVIGVDASDIRTLGAAAAVLVAVALAACWFPARRASGADPNQILRFE